MQQQDFDIASWFAGYLAGNLTSEQHKALEEWCATSADNQALFDKVCCGGNIRRLSTMADRYHRQERWWRIEEKINRKKKIRWYKWVAVFVVPLAIAWGLLEIPGREKEPEPVLSEAGAPGGAKAVLHMADGAVVDLADCAGFSLKEKDGTQIRKDSACLSYRRDTLSGEPVAVVYNRLDIPRGGEYALKLSDGTVVYLNALSSLRFPVAFQGECREVELIGEAYFQVAKDTARPFVVRVGEAQVRVLGTAFNVSAYPDDRMVKTTLESGSVEMKVADLEPVRLHPCQQAVFVSGNRRIDVQQVDVAAETAWKNGMFDIRNWPLVKIMDYLARWYEIEVFYRDESVKEIKFGCYVNRYSEIQPILELFEQTGKIRAELKGKTVVFSTK